MVIVHRVNSFERGNSVSGSQFGMLVKMILMAGPEKGTQFHKVAPEVLESYVGKYRMENDIFLWKSILYLMWSFLQLWLI
jgi:hypothetical protein